MLGERKIAIIFISKILTGKGEGCRVDLRVKIKIWY
jgi:hypothetical protein